MFAKRHGSSTVLHLLSAILLCVALLLIGAGPAVAASLWSATSDLSGPDGDASEPHVGIDAGGEAVAVWRAFDGSGRIEAASRLPGGTWSEPTRLSFKKGAFESRLAIDGAGDAVAVWRGAVGTNEIIEAASRAPDGAWSEPVQLVTPNNRVLAFNPQVAIDDAGEAVAVWGHRVGANEVVEMASRAPDGAWSQPREISAPTRSLAEPQVAINNAGEAVAMWRRLEDGANAVVEVAQRGPDGTWSPPTPLTASERGIIGAQVAIDGAGEEVAAWQRSSGAITIVESASRARGAGWSQSAPVSPPGANASGPQVAIDEAGEALVVWRHVDGANVTLEVVSRARGGAWSQPTPLSPPGTNISGPRIAIDGAGKALAVWQRSNGSEQSIEAASRAHDGTWSERTQISAPGTSTFGPQVAIDGAGHGVAVWEGSNGAKAIIQGSVFDPIGPKLGDISIPTAGRVGVPLSFSASGSGFSALTSSWSFGDGSGATSFEADHSYAGPGSYAVTVRVSDSAGNTAQSSAQVAVGDLAGAAPLVKVKKSRALLSLSCPPPADLPCSGFAALGYTKAKRQIAFGQGSFQIAGGEHSVLVLKPSARALRLLKAARAKGLKAVLSGEGLNPQMLRVRRVRSAP
jgi:hypothetical protein